MTKAGKSAQLDPNQMRQLPTEQLVDLIVQQQQVIEELQQEIFRLKLSLQKDSQTRISHKLLKNAQKSEERADCLGGSQNL